MPRQKGLIKVRGTMGDMTFYRTKDGHLVREKGGIDGKRIATDPAFQRTRENGAEFGTAGKGGQLVRKALRLLLKHARDRRVTSRLTQHLLQVIKTDTLNPRGSRRIEDGDMSLLDGFDFNKEGKLETFFFTGYTPTLDRAAGTLEVAVDAFVPQDLIDAPSGTTHLELVAGVGALNFEARTFEESRDSSGILPWDETEQPALTLTGSFTGGTTDPILQVLGIRFYQEVNGEMYPLRNGRYNALAIVGVDQV